MNGTIATITVFSASSSTVEVGNPLTLSAGVSTGLGATGYVTGSITFYDGVNQIGAASLTNGSANLVTTFSTAATHQLSASYAGNGTDAASNSNGESVTVTVPSAAVPLTPGGASSIYVVQQPALATNSILQFAANDKGTVSPASTLFLPSGFVASSVAVGTSGELYVAGATPSTNGTLAYAQVLIYAAGATGSAIPINTITGSASSFGSNVYGLYVDSAGRLYVSSRYEAATTNPYTISVFAASASGTAIPVQQIVLSSVLMPNALVADATGGIYAICDSGSVNDISFFSAGATGTVAPFAFSTATAHRSSRSRASRLMPRATSTSWKTRSTTVKAASLNLPRAPVEPPPLSEPLEANPQRSCTLRA